MKQMLITDLINQEVIHKVFGKGIITKVHDNYLTIQFATKIAQFEYPDIFKNFITAKDTNIQTEIINDINAKIQAKQAQTELQPAIDKIIKPSAKTSKTRSIEDGFGADYNVKHLAKQPILTYQQVEEQFGIKISGFGRGINITPKTVVLISSIDKKKSGFVYHDHWTNTGDYIYSGEGKTGNQTLTRGNKAIIEALNDKKDIHLFVKFSPQEYYYQGIFSLVNYNYEDEKDENGNIRKEYKFRLKKKA